MRFNFQKKHLLAAYRNVFNTPEGKIVFHDLMRRTHMVRSTFVSGDTHAAAFKEGERNVGMQILSFLNYRNEDIEALTQEAKTYLVGENHDNITSDGGSITGSNDI